MTSTSRAGSSHTAETISSGRRIWALRSGGMLLAAGGCAVSLSVLPATAQAQPPGRISTPRSAVATFCSHLPASKVSSNIGTTVYLLRAVLEKTTLECIYFGKVPATAKHPIDEVVISKEPGIPASEISTRARAEARVAAEAPKGVKLIFTSLPAVGPTAFSWTYAKSLNGGQLVGVANNKGSTGYGVALGGAAKTFGNAAGHVPAGEHLLALAQAA